MLHFDFELLRCDRHLHQPFTFTLLGANRPPAASPPGSGAYSSIAICDTGSCTPETCGCLLSVIDAIARIGLPSSGTSAIGVRPGLPPEASVLTSFW